MLGFTRTVLTGVAALLISTQGFAATPRYRGMTVGSTVSDSDLAVLGSWKANVIRYNLYFGSGDTATIEEYNQWLASQFAVVDQVLANAQANKLKVVLTLFTPPGGFSSYEVQTLHRIFAEAAFRDAYLEAWRTLATRYKDNAAIWGFDLLNEPAQREVAPGLDKWAVLALKAAQAIRAIDPNRTLIVEPPYGDHLRFFRLTKLPLKNVVYSFHMYWPLYFQHQGLYDNKLGVKYPNNAKRFNKAALRRNVAKAVDFARQNKVPIYVGEFSAIRWAPGHSALNYLKDIVGIFEEQGWSWTYHAFREGDPWSLEHSSTYLDATPAAKPTDRLKFMLQQFSKNKR